MQVLGLGRQASLLTIVDLAEREHARTHGRSARLTLLADGVEMEVERTRDDGPFDVWLVRLPADAGMADALSAIHEEFPATCSVTPRDGRIEFQCRPVGGGEPSASRRPIERLSALRPWPEVWRVRGDDPALERLSPEQLFRSMGELRASDVHLYPGSPPVFRVDNETRHAEHLAPVSQRQIEELVRDIAPPAAWDEFQKTRQCSFNYRQVGTAYSRVSAFVKAGVPHCTIRYLPEQIPTFEELHVPRPTMERLAALHEGLVLVSGMTGSGKSTTVAALIDWMNANQSRHILTIESPVEFVHLNKRSIVSQRNVGTDAPTAVQAVQGAVRHDPDVIFIGEMRDPDTIRAGINAAGTGHLVISTFHANTAAEVINRLVSFFDPVERDLVRLQLRDCLRCIVCQRLVPRREGGRVPALEFLFNDTLHIGDGILSGNTAALRVAMQQHASQSSVFEQSLLALLREQLITEETAAAYASSRDLFEQMRLGTYAAPSLDSMLYRPRAGQVGG